MKSSTVGKEQGQARVRTRDPQRRESIVHASVRLLARSGFTAVSMADIGTEVGIAASAIYWHFPSKQALLGSVFDECLERLLLAQGKAVEEGTDSEDAVRRLVEQHVDFVVTERDLARVYYRESVHLPEDDQHRLRRKQAGMVAVWTDVLCSARPELDSDRSRLLVDAAIGALQSTLRTRAVLPEEERRRMLADAAQRVLFG